MEITIKINGRIVAVEVSTEVAEVMDAEQLAQMDVAAERQRVAKALALRRDKCSSA